MANKEISELTAASAITGAELVHVVQGGNSRKVSIDGLFNATHKIPDAAFETSLRIYDSTDDTKGIAIDASAIATGTTRTITMPNSNVDLGKIGFTAASAITPAGTATDATGIPAGVQEIVISMHGVTVSGATSPAIRLGTSGGIVSTGYSAMNAAVAAAAAGAALESTAFTGDGAVSATGPLYGEVRITREAPGSNTWTVFGGLRNNTRANMFFGSVSLSGELDRVQLTTVAGAVTFGGASTLRVKWRY